METINLNQHYSAFKWAVSENWKDKNGLYDSIQYKIKVLTEEYNLSKWNIVDILFADYWEREHYLKYDANKGASLQNRIARYVNLYLNNLLRKCAVRSKDVQNQRIDPLDQRNQANLVWLDRDNERDDPDYQPDFLIDFTNPENLLVAKEMLEFAYGHFSKTEIDYLMGEIDIIEAASISKIGCEAFRKRLDRRKADFMQAILALERI